MRAPEPEALRQMSQTAIRAALDTGRMKWEAKSLSRAERGSIATYVGRSDAQIAAISTGSTLTVS